MKAIRVSEFGPPENMKYEEVPTPKPEAGQVLVKVHAAGVNPYETVQRAGNYAIKPQLPYTPGSDAAGVVESVGSGVTRVKPGDRVYTAQTLSGSYAEYTIALEGQVQPLPERISFAQGAGVWVPYGTAYHALYHSAHAHSSESVLVHGASGGVGTATVQFALAMGMNVAGTAGSPAGVDLLKKEGVHAAFNHAQSGYQEEMLKSTAGKGFDVIVEMAAHINLAWDTKLLAANGRVIVIGNRGEITINARELMTRRASIRAFTLWAITPAEEADIFAGIHAGLANGALVPIVGKEFLLKDAPQAHKYIDTAGNKIGKVVLVV